MEIKLLRGTTEREITIAFNQAFTDYLVPLQLTEVQLHEKMLADKVAFDISVGVFENGKLIAFMLHGLDVQYGKKVAYNGGTGVIPEKRGKGLCHRMYRFVLPILRDKGINSVFLEVIDNNIPAITSYKKSGFIVKRALHCYKGSLRALQPNIGLEVKKLHSYDWNRMESFWDVFPSWQNSKSVLESLTIENHALGAFVENTMVGYLIFSPKNNRLRQIAVDQKFRRQGIASALLSELTKNYEGTYSIINVDASAVGTITFLKRMGLHHYLEQFEMELEFDRY